MCSCWDILKQLSLLHCTGSIWGWSCWPLAPPPTHADFLKRFKCACFSCDCQWWYCMFLLSIHLTLKQRVPRVESSSRHHGPLGVKINVWESVWETDQAPCAPLTRSLVYTPSPSQQICKASIFARAQCNNSAQSRSSGTGSQTQTKTSG